MAARDDARNSGPGDPIGSSPPPPTGSSSSGKPAPIGVPATMYDKDGKIVPYTVPGVGHKIGDEKGNTTPYNTQSFNYTTQVAPRYFDGDEYIPANYPATNIWQIQQALAKIGLLTGTFTRNTWDNTTRNAYKELLGLANAQGLSVEQTLNELLATSSGQGESGGGGQFTVDANGNVVPVGGSEVPPLVTRKSDPAALRSTFRRAVIEMLGEGWSQADIDKMVAAYNQVEVAKQTEAYNMELSGQAGSITDMPTPEEFVQQEVLKKDPVGVQTEEALGFTQEFMDLASSPAWGLG